MLKCSPWGRAVFTSATLLVCAAACDSVLDIEPPKMRPGAGGEAGAPDEPTAGNGGSSGNNTPQGGDAGAAGEPPVVGGNAGAGGEGGEPPARECETDATRCSGADAKTPEVCDASGQWTPNTDEANGHCPNLCANGKCTECKDGAKQCSVCAEGDAECSTNQPQKCVDGAWQDDGEACAQYCNDGSCLTATSCDEINAARTTCAGTESCCSSLLVPGGTFSRDFDRDQNVPDPVCTAELTPFYLDKFEVTVGRMRQFVAAYTTNIVKAGAGKSKRIAEDTGWDTAYVADLPQDKDELIALLKCPGGTWSDMLLEHNDLPVDCVTFPVAYAFCIWDGGRLPTEAEWNFAAAGGEEQRPYPWKAPDVGLPITSDHANYSAASAIGVGLKQQGNGRWGQADLAGNIAERTLDYLRDYPDVCKDCMGATPAATRTARGGSYALGPDFLFVSIRGDAEPNLSLAGLGFRCARDLN